MVAAACEGIDLSIRVAFFDEARFGRINRPVKCWAPSGMRPQVGSQTVREYVYAYSAVSILDGVIDSLILPTMQLECFEMYCRFVSSCHPDELIVLVCDGAGSHTAKTLELPANIRIINLPPYSPELNPVEQVWDLIRERHFANKTFDTLDAVEDQLIDALRALDDDPITLQTLTARDWILNTL